MSNVPMTLPQLMLAEHETRYGHSSTFVELDDGRIMHVACEVCTYSEDGGLTWSEQKWMADVNGNRVGAAETSLVKLSGRNAVGLAARSPDEPSDTTYPLPPRCLRFQYWRSDDGGQSWQPPVLMTAPGTSTAGYQDTFLRTSSGRIVLPVAQALGQRTNRNDQTLPIHRVGELRPAHAGKLVKNQFLGTGGHFFDSRFCCVYILYSDDEGRTWQRNQDGELIPLLDWNAAYSYVVEPSVTEVVPGRLLVFMRTGLGRLFQAWSNDNGETWTRPQPTSLAAATTPAQIRTLPNGHLLCVWNQESEEEIKRGYSRTRLSSAISRNGGSVWEFFQNVQSIHETTRVEPGPICPVRPVELYTEPGQPAPVRPVEHVIGQDVSGRWSYPSVFVGKDRVLIAHTYTTYDEHPTRAEFIRSSLKEGGIDQKLKVLPLKWFYGGKEPADNPFLKEAYEPAKP